MNTKLGQEPAFPTDRVNSQQGVSKRFYAACAAIQGILGNKTLIDNGDDISIHWVTRTAYKIADELLKQEKDDV